jgi:hypothetical protein
MSSPSFATFITFCLEKNEYIEVPTPTPSHYFIHDISMNAIQGGIGGPNPDPISLETAYIYTNFLAGNFSYLGTDGAVKNAVQAAIWQYEEETTGSLTGDALTIYNAANDAVNVDYTWTSFGGVMVANIGHHSTFTYAQSMLVAVPEPTTILLSGLGLLGIAAVLRRKFHNKA